MSDQDLRVAMIGTGNMGGRMSQRLLEHGVDLVVYDADPKKSEPFGDRALPSVEAVANVVDVIFMSLPDSGVVESVMRDGAHLLQHVHKGQVIVDLSTANPESTKQLHEELAEKGVDFLDAGISGGAAGADKGTLTLMVGGSADVLERVRPLLESFSSSIYFMGPSGAGHTTKILNNFLNAVNLAASAEVMIAAHKAGLDLGQVLDVVNHSSGVNFATTNRFPHIIEGDYLEGGLTGELMAKDVSLYVDLVQDLKVASMLGSSCLLAFRVANAIGYGDQISNRVVDALGDLSGGVRVASKGAL